MERKIHNRPDISNTEDTRKLPKSRLRLFPILTLSAFCLPILLGLAGTWLPACGYLPVIGATQFTFNGFHELFQHPAYPGAIRATLISGLGATAFALISSLWITVCTYQTVVWRCIVRLLSPLLAVPHAAFAIGFGFLVAPSGWLIRIVSPDITGFIFPPDWLTIKDPYGFSLTIALAVKEMPFLLLMCVSALNQLDVRRTVWVGRSLGYSSVRIWTRLILPQLYPQLRLPVLAVLAYSLSVVDVALLLGPSVPPTFSVLIDRWFNDPEVSNRLIGAAGATWLFAVVACAILGALFCEWILTRIVSKRLINGSRDTILEYVRWTGAGVAIVMLTVSLCSLLVLIIWSFTKVWRFPDSLPSAFTLKYWFKGIPIVTDPMLTTLIVGGMATLVGIVLVIGCLEYEVRLKLQGRKVDTKWILWLVYLPLLIPQIAFLFGIQTAAVILGIEGTWLSMVSVHLIFVLPYIFLTLGNFYRGYDDRFMQVAMSLSGSALISFFRIKLPMLAKPIAFAMATGFAVSVAQYLPTLYLGAGRFMTITTETVSIASGSDRRVLAVHALCQFLLPMVVYCCAIFLPAWIFRNRKAMQN